MKDKRLNLDFVALERKARALSTLVRLESDHWKLAFYQRELAEVTAALDEMRRASCGQKALRASA